MKHSGLEEQRLAVYTWHFLSFCSSCTRRAPLWGEVQAHKPWAFHDRFLLGKETGVKKHLFASKFLTFQSLFKCVVLGVLCMDLSRGLWGG